MTTEENKIEAEVERGYQRAAEDFIYPKGVVNTDDYNNYLLYKDKWTNHVQRFYKLKKNKKVELDLAQSPDKIKTLLDGVEVSKEERKEIEKLNSEINFLIKTAILYKKRAFGDKRVILTEEGFVADELSGVSPIIIDLASRFYKVDEIHQVLCEDLEVTSVTENQIKNVIKENITKIKSLQEEFQKDYSDVRLAYKRSRLEELQYLYNIRKSAYNRSQSRDDERQLMTLLESVKKEIQGDLVVNANMNLQIEEKSNQFIEQEMLKTLNISMFVLARICGRMNVNPDLILSRLAHSRYAQFSGYSPQGLSSTAETDPIDYASNITYNWNEIKAKNEEYLEDNKKLAELPIPKEGAEDIKTKLLKRLAEAKKPLEAGKNNLLDKNS